MWFQRVAGHQVDRDAELLGQVLLDANEVEQRHRSIEGDQYVEVAVRLLFATRVRPEDTEFPDRVLLPELWLERGKFRPDFLGVAHIGVSPATSICVVVGGKLSWRGL